MFELLLTADENNADAFSFAFDRGEEAPAEASLVTEGADPRMGRLEEPRDEVKEETNIDEFLLMPVETDDILGVN